MADTPQPFVREGSPHDRPQPVNATYLAAPPDQFIRVTFDTPLQSVAAPDFHPSDWVVYYGNWATNIVFWSYISGTDVWLKFVNTVPRARPNIVSYSAVNQDVKSLKHGTPAEPFLNFPIT